MNATVSDTLNKAADLIEQRGWSKGAMSMYGLGLDGGICAMGAIYAATKGRLAESHMRDSDTYEFVAECPAGQAMVRYLEWADGPVTLWRWNDIIVGKPEPVIAALRACAVIEASREREPAAVSA